MLCENCREKAATTHITKTINGLKKEYFLCQKCANQLGLNSFNFFNSNDFFDVFLNNKKTANVKENTCPSCKSRYKDIVETGRMGCPKCYETFNEELTPSLIKIQKKLQHIGKQPKVESSEINELEELEKELKQAVLREEYEKAAELRDIIKSKRGV